MKIIYILIPLSFLILFIAIYFFFWAVNNNQYEDVETHALHILFDDCKNTKIKF